jgi:hypothetical protein
MTYMAALTMLDWCLLQSTVAKPSVVEMLASFVWHPMYGIIQSRRDDQALGEKNSTAQAMLHEDPAGTVQEEQQIQQTSSRIQMLVENIRAMLRLMIAMDVLSGTLECMLCYGHLKAWQSSISSCTSALPARSNFVKLACYLPLPSSAFASVTPSYMAPMLFKLCTTAVAGFLLGVQLEFTYMCGRMVLIIVGYPKIGPLFMFDKPCLALSISELWSNRWHQVLRYYFTGLGYTLADRLTTALVTGFSWLLKGSSTVTVSKQQRQLQRQRQQQRQQQQQDQPPAIHPGLQKQLKRAMRTLVVFAISGLVHEYIVWAAFGSWTWRQLAFFMFQAFAVISEGLGSEVLTYTGKSSTSVPNWLRRVWVFGFAAWSAPWFVDVYLHHRHYQNYAPPFLIPLTTELFKHYGLCLCEA